MRENRLFIFFSVLFLTAGSLVPMFAEESPQPADSSPRRLLTFVSVSGKFKDSDKSFLYNSLVTALASARGDVTVVEGPEASAEENGARQSDAGRSSEAFARLCDSWLSVAVTYEEETVGITYELFDMAKGASVDRGELRKEIPADLNLAGFFWFEIAETLRGSLPPLARTTSVYVRAVPGTRITGLSGEPVLVPASGVAAFGVPIPGSYHIRAERASYEPLESDVFFEKSGQTVKLDQRAPPNFGLDLYTYDFQFLGAAATWFWGPSGFHMKLGVTSFLLGIYLPMNLKSDTGKTASILVSKQLLYPEFRFGSYFNSPGSTYRFYWSAGVVLRFMFSEYYVGLEPIAPAAFQPGLGFEWKPAQGQCWFLEYVPLAYVTSDAERLIGTYPGTNFVNYGRLAGTVVEWLNMRAGYRWAF
jgi:hypothetical protein